MEAGNNRIRKDTFYLYVPPLYYYSILLTLKYKILQEACSLTYSPINIKSTFEATSIQPINPRQVLPAEKH